MAPIVRLSVPVLIVALWLLPLPGCAGWAREQPSAPPVHGGGVDPAAAARLVVEQTNAFRRQQERGTLRVEPALTDTALDFARYMARTGRYGHTADGAEPADRAVAHGYAYCIIAENIGEYRAPGLGTWRLADQLFQGWQRSPEHRANLLDADVTETGVGIARNDATGSYLGVQLFGRPKSASVTFTFANRTDTPIAYRLGDQPFTLPPSTVRTHETCGATTLELGAGQLPAPIRRSLRGGEQLVVVRAPDGSLRIDPE